MSMIRRVAIVVILAAVGYGSFVILGSAPKPEEPAAMTIQLGNNSWKAQTRIEIAKSGSGEYTDVTLAGGGLGAGDFVELTLAGGQEQCRYDMRFTNAEGAVFERPDLDLCAATFYHFDDK